jgi:hypothetical protein
MDEITYPRAEIVQVLRDLNILVVSIDRIGSYTHDMSSSEAATLLDEFLDAWDVWPRLVRARRLLSAPFSTELGPDDREELERELEGTPYWSPSRRHPPLEERLSPEHSDDDE